MTRTAGGAWVAGRSRGANGRQDVVVHGERDEERKGHEPDEEEEDCLI